MVDGLMVMETAVCWRPMDGTILSFLAGNVYSDWLLPLKVLHLKEFASP